MAISNSNFSPGWEISQEWDGLQGGGSIESYYYYKKRRVQKKTTDAAEKAPSVKVPPSDSELRLRMVIAESKKLGVLPSEK